jgi:hypothetical protein
VKILIDWLILNNVMVMKDFRLSAVYFYVVRFMIGLFLG